MTKFTFLASLTALGIYALIIMGGVVRVSESGLGCPDWPLCHGKFTPPLERTALIEYSHRMLVTLVGFAVLGTAVAAWRGHKRQRWAVVPATLALVLLVAQAGLGGATVKANLEAELVTAHLGLALILLGAVLTTALSLKQPERAEPRRRLLLPWIAIAALSLFATMLVGAYIGSSGAGLACPDLPLCDGKPIPLDNRYVQAHLLHRSLAALTTLLVLLAVAQAWRLRLRDSWLRLTLTLAVTSVLFQIFLGAINVWLQTPEPLVVAHLGNGAFLWTTLLAAGLRLVRASEAEPIAPRPMPQPVRGY